jgi:hypothetical protein
MTTQSPTFRDFNPTGDVRVTQIKETTDGLIALVRDFTRASGPQTQRRASVACTAYEEASMWAVKALFSEDAIKGDDGGAKGADPTEHPMTAEGGDPALGNGRSEEPGDAAP